MLLLTPIGLTGTDVRARCLPGSLDQLFIDRIMADEINIASEEARLRAAVRSGTARSLKTQTCSKQVKSDMKRLYGGRLVDSAPGGLIVAQIKATSKGKCAFCHIALATTLDHLFPKAVHPRLAVEPENLAPACYDCNLGRKKGSGRMSVTPYHDSWVEQVPWLRAKVVDPARPERLSFRVAKHASFSAGQYQALKEMFSETRLNERYGYLAVSDLSTLGARLRDANPSPTAQEAHAALADRLSERLTGLGPNRWETAAADAWLRAVDRIDWAKAGLPI